MLTGETLGPYRVLEKLGEGGMGQVYRARDTKLDRDVAIKILPEAFAHDADRLARFQREAKTLASLNHPNIAQIFGLEQADDIHALVMELVEGEDLSQRIARGAVPLDEALPIAKQIAEALEAAHEQGIIHRDLKPANIKIRADGTVKVLDFGLAKAMESVSALRASAGQALSQAPTITTPAMPFDFRSGHPEHGRGVMTGVGMILGTAAYMSPEQARGKTVDRRADIWAFGAVLFEMLTGRRAFDGEDISDTLANVLKREPDWSVLPPDVPPAVRALLRRCLEKDPRKRIADISTTRFVLEEAAGLAAAEEERSRSALHPSAEQSAATAVPASRARTGWWLTAAAALFVGGVASGAAVWWAMIPQPPGVVRSTLSASGETALIPQGQDRDIAITPDGTRLVYRGVNRLLIRALDQLEPVTLIESANPRLPFVSPDGRWVGFFDRGALNKVAITGGPPVTIVEQLDGVGRGATWAPDGTIVFATNAASGLLRVSAAGGEPVVLTKPDSARAGDHVWPEVLPGGQAVLFTTLAESALESAQVEMLNLRTGATKVLVRGGSHAQYVPSGHLVYGAAGRLLAVPFDLDRLEVVGEPVAVLEGVMTTFTGAVNATVAMNGTLAYVGGTGGVGPRSIVSVDRQGRVSELPEFPVGRYRDLDVSPDGTRLAVATPEDVWVYEFGRATLSRLTTDPSPDTLPLWTPDGLRIAFKSMRAGYPELFWRRSDGTGSDERLFSHPAGPRLFDLHPNGWSPDAAHLIFSQVIAGAQLGNDCTIAQAPTAPTAEVETLVSNGFCNAFAVPSPDHRWLAYFSNVSGRNEIYVERYPQGGSRQQLSSNGGILPRWSHDGRELYFRSLDDRQVLAVAVQGGSTLVADRPQVLFEMRMSPRNPGTRPYDVAPDGRFLIIRDEQSDADGDVAPDVMLVQHWAEEVRRLAPSR